MPLTFSGPAPEPTTTSTTQPDFAALVASGVVTTPFAEEEAELTDEALFQSTSTTTSTSTTVPEATTTEAARSAPQTSAPASTTTQPPSPPPASDAGARSGAEKEFASRINSHRANNGLPALTRSGALDSYARSWAETMAERGDLAHSNIGSLLGSWSAVAENVGVGGSVDSIFDALASSGSHNTNMLGDYTHMGIGVWEDAEGRLWTAHVFAR